MLNLVFVAKEHHVIVVAALVAESGPKSVHAAEK